MVCASLMGSVQLVPGREVVVTLTSADGSAQGNHYNLSYYNLFQLIIGGCI